MNKIIKTLIPLIIFLTAFLTVFFVGRAINSQDTNTDTETSFVNDIPVISDTPGEEKNESGGSPSGQENSTEASDPVDPVVNKAVEDIMRNLDPGLPSEYFF